MLGYQNTPQNLEILANCPSLQRFGQTPWAMNGLWAFAALMVGDNLGVDAFQKRLRRELVEAPDGGIVAMDWYEAEPALGVKPKGVLLLLSTFTGDALPFCVRTPCQYFAARGWRCVVQVKRGCGMVMPNEQPAGKDNIKPKPWCLSGFDDVQLAVDHVARECPGLPIMGIGFSTGAGQLRNYVNTTGKDCKLSGAVVLDASPKWSDAIPSCDERVPLIAQALNFALQVTQKQCGRELETLSPDISNKVMRGGILDYVLNNLAPAHGFERSVAGAHKYMESCNPATATIDSVPTLELSTINDMIMNADMARGVQGMYKDSPSVITAMTNNGTHMIRWEGWWPQCWVSRVAHEFLESVLQQTLN